MNLTDNEIMKAFEICYTGDEEDCLNCPFCDEDGECMDKGDSKLLEEVGYLLNRQKAEIERLEEKSRGDDKLLNDRVQEAVNSVSKANQKYVDALEKAFNNKVAELKSAKREATKEFAERLKEKCHLQQNKCGDFTKLITFEDVDNLVKEMTAQ